MAITSAKSSLVFFLIGVTLWTVTASQLRRRYPGDWGDDGQYLVAARSLCDQVGYRLRSRPGDPVATKYPIGASAITALVMAVLPGSVSTEHDWRAGRIVVITAGVLLALTSRKFFRLSGFSDWPSVLLALTTICFPLMIGLTATLMSDVPYVLVCVVLMVRWIRRSRSESATAGEWVMDGALAGLGWLIRANGITLVVAAVAAALPGRSRWGRSALVLLGVACLKIPAMLSVENLPGPRDTGGYVGEQLAAYQAAEHLWSVPLANLSRLPRLVLSTVCAPSEWTARVIAVFSEWTFLRTIATFVACGLLIGGLTRLVRRGVWPAALWVHAGLTLAIYVGWHYRIDHRFLLPLIPLILAACSIGAEMVWRHRASVPCFGAGTLAGTSLVVLGMVWRSYPSGGVLPDATLPKVTAMLKIISAETPKNAVIICLRPEFIYLNTGRQAIPFRDDDVLVSGKPVSWTRLRRWISFAEDRPIYLLTNELSEISESEIFQNQDDDPPQLTPVRDTPDGHLWRVEFPRKY